MTTQLTGEAAGSGEYCRASRSMAMSVLQSLWVNGPVANTGEATE